MSKDWALPQYPKLTDAQTAANELVLRFEQVYGLTVDQLGLSEVSKEHTHGFVFTVQF